MAYRADSTGSSISVLVDNVATPAAGDVQAVKILDGTAGSGAVIAGDNANGLDVDVTRVQGTVTTAPLRPSTANAPVRVAAAVSSTQLVAANANRRDCLIYNESTAVLYLLIGTGTASNVNYSVQIAGGGYYEVSYGYTGRLAGIWAAANGAAMVTELV